MQKSESQFSYDSYMNWTASFSKYEILTANISTETFFGNKVIVGQLLTVLTVTKGT